MKERSSASIDYGASAPGEEIMKHLGFTSEHVTAAALRLLGRNEEADKEFGGDTTNVAPDFSAGRPLVGRPRYPYRIGSIDGIPAESRRKRSRGNSAHRSRRDRTRPLNNSTMHGTG